MKENTHFSQGRKRSARAVTAALCVAGLCLTGLSVVAHPLRRMRVLRWEHKSKEALAMVLNEERSLTTDANSERPGT